MSDYQSRSSVRFRINTGSAWASNTTPWDLNEFLLMKTANGKISPSVRLGRGKAQFVESMAIGMVIDRSPSAVNVTATVTVAQLITGLITSTSAAAVAATLPTATAVANEIGARQGTTFEFIVDNSAGSNAVTLVVGSGMTASGSLVVAAGASIRFTLLFTSATAALLVRSLSGGEAQTVSSLTTNTISESTAANGVAVDGVQLKDGIVFRRPAPVSINVTATATPAEILSGYIKSTSAAAVAITTPTATAIAAALAGGAAQGTSFDLVIDNSAGANTVTLTLDASIAVVTPAVTGGATLTVSTANAIGIFRIVFTSGTTAKIFRIA